MTPLIYADFGVGTSVAFPLDYKEMMSDMDNYMISADESATLAARGETDRPRGMIHINNSSESHTAASAACGAVSGEQIEASRQYDVDTAQAGGRICPDCWAWYLAYHCRRDCRGALMFQGGHDSFGCPTPGSTPGERHVAWLRLQNCQQHAHDQPYGQVRARGLGR